MDFLLGRIQEPQAGSVHDWIGEHQVRLQTAYAGVRWRQQSAADRQKERHDQGVVDVQLVEGHLVFLRNCGVRGRHKISDLWSPVVYQVLKAPKEGGTLYTIAPADQLDQVKHVHRSLLKGRIQSNPGNPVPPPTQLEDQPGPPEEEVEDEENLWVRVSAQPLAGLPPSSAVVTVEPPHVPSCTLPPVDQAVAGLPTKHAESDPLLEDTLGTTRNESNQQAVRKTNRVTAGQHSNPHHLPKAIGRGGLGGL